MLFENCRLKAKRVVNPIIDWTDNDVWDFLNDAGCPVNPLYEEGRCRVGCVGCPVAGQAGRIEEFKRWPKYKDLYMLAFGKMLHERRLRGLRTVWQTPEDVYNWSMGFDVLPGQIDWFEEMEEDAYE